MLTTVQEHGLVPTNVLMTGVCSSLILRTGGMENHETVDSAHLCRVVGRSVHGATLIVEEKYDKCGKTITSTLSSIQDPFQQGRRENTLFSIQNKTDTITEVCRVLSAVYDDESCVYAVAMLKLTRAETTKQTNNSHNEKRLIGVFSGIASGDRVGQMDRVDEFPEQDDVRLALLKRQDTQVKQPQRPPNQPVNPFVQSSKQNYELVLAAIGKTNEVRSYKLKVRATTKQSEGGFQLHSVRRKQTGSEQGVCWFDWCPRTGVMSFATVEKDKSLKKNGTIYNFYTASLSSSVPLSAGSPISPTSQQIEKKRSQQGVKGDKHIVKLIKVKAVLRFDLLPFANSCQPVVPGIARARLALAWDNIPYIILSSIHQRLRNTSEANQQLTPVPEDAHEDRLFSPLGLSSLGQYPSTLPCADSPSCSSGKSSPRKRRHSANCAITPHVNKMGPRRRRPASTRKDGELEINILVFGQTFLRRFFFPIHLPFYKTTRLPRVLPLSPVSPKSPATPMTPSSLPGTPKSQKANGSQLKEIFDIDTLSKLITGSEVLIPIPEDSSYLGTRLCHELWTYSEPIIIPRRAGVGIVTSDFVFGPHIPQSSQGTYTTRFIPIFHILGAIHNSPATTGPALSYSCLSATKTLKDIFGCNGNCYIKGSGNAALTSRLNKVTAGLSIGDLNGTDEGITGGQTSEYSTDANEMEQGRGSMLSTSCGDTEYDDPLASSVISPMSMGRRNKLSDPITPKLYDILAWPIIQFLGAGTKDLKSPSSFSASMRRLHAENTQAFSARVSPSASPSLLRTVASRERSPEGRSISSGTNREMKACHSPLSKVGRDEEFDGQRSSAAFKSPFASTLKHRSEINEPKGRGDQPLSISTRHRRTPSYMFGEGSSTQAMTPGAVTQFSSFSSPSPAISLPISMSLHPECERTEALVRGNQEFLTKFFFPSSTTFCVESFFEHSFARGHFPGCLGFRYEVLTTAGLDLGCCSNRHVLAYSPGWTGDYCWNVFENGLDASRGCEGTHGGEEKDVVIYDSQLCRFLKLDFDINKFAELPKRKQRITNDELAEESSAVSEDTCMDENGAVEQYEEEEENDEWESAGKDNEEFGGFTSSTMNCPHSQHTAVGTKRKKIATERRVISRMSLMTLLRAFNGPRRGVRTREGNEETQTLLTRYFISVVSRGLLTSRILSCYIDHLSFLRMNARPGLRCFIPFLLMCKGAYHANLNFFSSSLKTGRDRPRSMIVEYNAIPSLDCYGKMTEFIERCDESSYRRYIDGYFEELDEKKSEVSRVSRNGKGMLESFVNLYANACTDEGSPRMIFWELFGLGYCGREREFDSSSSRSSGDRRSSGGTNSKVSDFATNILFKEREVVESFLNAKYNLLRCIYSEIKYILGFATDNRVGVSEISRFISSPGRQELSQYLDTHNDTPLCQSKGVASLIYKMLRTYRKVSIRQRVSPPEEWVSDFERYCNLFYPSYQIKQLRMQEVIPTKALFGNKDIGLRRSPDMFELKDKEKDNMPNTTGNPQPILKSTGEKITLQHCGVEGVVNNDYESVFTCLALDEWQRSERVSQKQVDTNKSQIVAFLTLECLRTGKFIPNSKYSMNKRPTERVLEDLTISISSKTKGQGGYNKKSKSDNTTNTTTTNTKSNSGSDDKTKGGSK